MSMVSRAMRIRRSSGRYCRVRMLWRRSASFTRITRMSSTMARSIFRKVSAWRSSEVEKGILLILVTPSTMWRTSRPKYSWIRSGVGEGVLEDVVEQSRRPRRRGPSACRPGSPRPRGGGRGRARPRRGSAPCARPPRRCRPCAGSRGRRPGGGARRSRRCPRSGSWRARNGSCRRLQFRGAPAGRRQEKPPFLDSPLRRGPIIRASVAERSFASIAFRETAR